MEESFDAVYHELMLYDWHLLGEDYEIFCPHCGEPLYKDDYPEFEIVDGEGFICPICENVI